MMGPPLPDGYHVEYLDEAEREKYRVVPVRGWLYTTDGARFLAGAPVAAAGEITVRQGRPTFLSNRSGHYRPGPETLDAVLRILSDSGVDVRDVEIEVCR